MRSFYAGATLHDSTAMDAGIEQVVATAAKAKDLIDLRIVVVNPTPLRGKGKTDTHRVLDLTRMRNKFGTLITADLR